MKLEHSFTVPAPVDQAWATLLDIEGVAPCMPGATLTGIEGDEFSGTVKVKLGPVSLSYSGKGRFLERDDAAHTVVIDASGRDKNGNGTAGASVHARMEPAGADLTKVVVVTDLKITGRPAQFGRGVMQDVGGKIIGQFADCLAAKMAASADAAPVAGAGGADDLAATPSDADQAAPVAGAAGLGTAPGAQAAAQVADAVAATTGTLPVTGTDDATTGTLPATDDATTGGAANAPAPTVAAATTPTGGPRPAAPRPAPVRPLPTSSSPAAPAQPAAELDLGSAVLPVLARRFGPPALVALVAAVLAWRLVRRRR